jgi:hypothetical protein
MPKQELEELDGFRVGDKVLFVPEWPGDNKSYETTEEEWFNLARLPSTVIEIDTEWQDFSPAMTWVTVARGDDGVAWAMWTKYLINLTRQPFVCFEVEE